MDEFLEQFVLESREQIEAATADLLALEKSPHEVERLDPIYRAFHTLKGGAGIIEFDAMVQRVHGVESELAEAQAGRRGIDRMLIDAGLRCLDDVGGWLDHIERHDGLPDAAALQSDESAPLATPPAVSASASPLLRKVLAEQLALLQTGNGDFSPGRLASASRVAVNVMRQRQDDASVAAIEQALADAIRSRDAAVLVAAVTDCVSTFDSVDAKPAAGAIGADTDLASRTLRVDIERVDALVRLSGELSAAGSAIGHLIRAEASGSAAVSERLRQRLRLLEHLLGQLQRSVVSMRVLPLRPVFQRFERLTRELAIELGKPVELQIEGGETEADKAIVEMLSEPLLHVLRNAMDHGIEEPAERQARGKAATACIVIRASREGDNVVIEIADDGRGIDVERVRAVARARQLFDDPTLDAMPADAVIDLIFAAGFSTSDSVTRLSGRGVGMDAVRSAAERFGGRVGLASRPGTGTTVRITLPFSAMMSRIMVVTAAGQRFGLPFDAVIETAQVAAADLVGIGTAQAVVLRDRTIPIIDLAQVLKLESATEPRPQTTLVVACIDGELNALRVDRVDEQLDIMISRLDGLLEGMQGIAGSAVMGDGSVLLILDLTEILIKG